MNILLLGSGGRESALAWKIQQSPLCDNLFIAPGNPGTVQYGSNVNLAINDFKGISAFITANAIELLIIGPEDPLVNGLHDYLETLSEHNKLMIIGPKQKGAQLEGSKAFSKAFMQKYNIPTAAYATFDLNQKTEAMAYIQQHTLPIVVKADGLAAGKGVIICQSHEEAKNELNSFFDDNKFGNAGHTVVIEQFLTGIELSVFALTNGTQYIILPEAKDYKRVGEGDTGPNTGGMGSISPVPFADKAFMQKVDKEIIQPTITGLAKENIPYQGFIFFGLINCADGVYVIEYNARMGDPETQSVMARLQSDFVAHCIACAQGTLAQKDVVYTDNTVATVILTAKGYPDAYSKGNFIENLDQIADSLIFHAGTSLNTENQLVSSGGRVLAITSQAPSLSEALQKSYKNINTVAMANKQYRKDIGYEFV